MPIAEIGNLKTRYELTGRETGPVLVLSNSLGTNLSMWQPQLEQLERHFRLLRYDTRGHGQSSATPGDYTIEQLARDVLALVDFLHFDRVNFCGLSMGGMIGMWLGIHAPERLCRLVLSSTAARIGSDEIWNKRIASVGSGGMKAISAAVVERWFTAEFRKRETALVEWTQQMVEATSPAGYASCCAALRDANLQNEIGQVKVPTLVIYGASDPAVPVPDARFLSDNIPGAQSIELAAAHLSNIEQAEWFTEALMKFLSQ